MHTVINTSIIQLMINVLFNLFILLFLVRYLYYPGAKRKDYVFTFISVGVVVHLMCYMLNNVTIELGFALGLFAIFSVIRYRTITIAIKEMTYLFIVIAISVINAISNYTLSYTELIFANFIILVIIAMFERFDGKYKIANQPILYERIDLIVPSKRKELFQDLEKRTGYHIVDVTIERINFLNDTAELTVFYTIQKQ